MLTVSAWIVTTETGESSQLEKPISITQTQPTATIDGIVYDIEWFEKRAVWLTSADAKKKQQDVGVD